MTDSRQALSPLERASISTGSARSNPRVARGLALAESLLRQPNVGRLLHVYGATGLSRGQATADEIDAGRFIDVTALAVRSDLHHVFAYSPPSGYLFDAHGRELLTRSQHAWLLDHFYTRNMHPSVSTTNHGWLAVAVVFAKYLGLAVEEDTFDTPWDLDDVDTPADRCVVVTTMNFDCTRFGETILERRFTYNAKAAALPTGFIIFDRHSSYSTSFYLDNGGSISLGKLLNPYRKCVVIDNMCFLSSDYNGESIDMYKFLDLELSDDDSIGRYYSIPIQGWLIDMCKHGDLLVTIESNCEHWSSGRDAGNPLTKGLRLRIAAYQGNEFLGAFEPKSDDAVVFARVIEASSERLFVGVDPEDGGIISYSGGNADDWRGLPAIDRWVLDSDGLIRYESQRRWNEIVQQAELSFGGRLIGLVDAYVSSCDDGTMTIAAQDQWVVTLQDPSSLAAVADGVHRVIGARLTFDVVSEDDLEY